MLHRIFGRTAISLAIFALTISALSAQDSDKQDKSLDVRSPVGDLHVGPDADAKKAGLPLYPGARPKRDENNDPLNLGVLTESFGLKLVVAKYESGDAPAKVISYYRDKLKKYGKVLDVIHRKTTATSRLNRTMRILRKASN